MSDAAILGQVALGYSPFIDRNRAVTATRLTVFPLKPDAVLDVGQLLQEVGNVWPASGARVSLNVVSESLLQELLLARPSANLMVEVPAFMASDPVNAAALIALHAHGSTLLLKGRPLQELPRQVLPCFKYSIIDLADDRRIGDPSAPTGVTRTIGHVQSGVRSVADMEACFARGAEAVLGWPIDDAVTTTGARNGQTVAAPGMVAIVELIRQVDYEESIERLENTPQMNISLRISSSPLLRTSSSISRPRRTAANITGFRFTSLLAVASSSASQRFRRL